MIGPRTMLRGFAGAYLGARYPLFVSYSLTYRCNGKCDYCAVDSQSVPEMEFSTIVNILRQMVHLGLMRISLTGGEPLLHPEFSRVVGLLHDLGVDATCNTNGFLVEQHLNALSQLKSVTVSVDGPREVHDAARGEGAYEKAISGIALLKKNRIPVRIAAVLSDHNVERIDDLADVAAKLGVPLVVQPAWDHLLGSCLPNPHMPSAQDMQKAITRLIELKKHNALILNSNSCLDHYLNWPDEAPIGCLAGRLTYRLEPDGRFTHCERMPPEPTWVDLKKVRVDQALKHLGRAGCNRCWCTGQVELQLARNFKTGSIQTLIRSTPTIGK